MDRLAASAVAPRLVVSLPRPPSRAPALVQSPSRLYAGRATAPAMSLGFESLKGTFTVDVARAEGRPLDVPLAAPFTIATSRLDAVRNVAVRVELRGGSVGWGEAPVLPHVTAEDQPVALEGAAEACRALVRAPPAALGEALAEIGRVLPGHGYASVRMLLG